jgi:hypothetical protein
MYNWYFSNSDDKGKKLKVEFSAYSQDKTEENPQNFLLLNYITESLNKEKLLKLFITAVKVKFFQTEIEKSAKNQFRSILKIMELPKIIQYSGYLGFQGKQIFFDDLIYEAYYSDLVFYEGTSTTITGAFKASLNAKTRIKGSYYDLVGPFKFDVYYLYNY